MHKFILAVFATVAGFATVQAQARDTIVAQCGGAGRSMTVLKKGFGPGAGSLYGNIDSNGIRGTLQACNQVGYYDPSATRPYTIYRCETRWSNGARLVAIVGASFIGGRGHGSVQLLVASGNYIDQNGRSTSLGVVQPCKVY